MQVRSRIPAAVAVLAALALIPAGALAQAAGRLMLEVVDERGAPVSGAEVTVTSADKADFRADGTTNKKGVVSFSFADATLAYEFRLEKEGHQGLVTQLQPQVKGIAREQVVLPSASARPPSTAGAEQGGARRRFTPAEEAFNAAVTALEGGDRATARTKFQEALALDATMVQARSGLAGIHFEEKRYQDAVREATAVVEAEADDARAWRILYAAHHELGNARESAVALSRLRALDQEGGTAAMLYNEGVDALRLGDRVAARQRFQEALESDPELVAAIDGLASLLLADGEHAEAAALAERVLAKDPRHQRALTTRYEAYRLMGDEARAEEALAALSAVVPQKGTGRLLQEGIAKFASGDAAGARDLFARLLEAEPDHADAHYRIGVCYVNLGDNAKARQHLERFLALAPRSPEAANAREMLGYLQ